MTALRCCNRLVKRQTCLPLSQTFDISVWVSLRNVWYSLSSATLFWSWRSREIHVCVNANAGQSSCVTIVFIPVNCFDNDWRNQRKTKIVWLNSSECQTSTAYNAHDYFGSGDKSSIILFKAKHAVAHTFPADPQCTSCSMRPYLGVGGGPVC